MTNIEIYETIRRNNKRIQEMMNPNVFVLNNIVADLLAENRTLQKQCAHEFEEGTCRYCFLMEEEDSDD